MNTFDAAFIFHFSFLSHASGKTDVLQVSSSEEDEAITAVDEYEDHNAPNLQVFTFSEIKAATSNFSCENRLGEGGYGPVYKVRLSTIL